MSLRKILKDIANDIADGFENYKDVLDCILEQLKVIKQ